MRKIYCCVIFVYRCVNNKVSICLLSKDNKRWEPVYFENKDTEKARKLLHQMFKIKGGKFYKDRDVDWMQFLTVQKGKVVYKIWTSATRVREDVGLGLPKGYKAIKWFKKQDVFGKLSHWKGYARSFRKVFTQDSYWECVNTE